MANILDQDDEAAQEETKNKSVHPYQTLGPERVLDAVESLGIQTDARVLALNSY